MKKKFMLLQAIENGFTTNVSVQSSSGVGTLELSYAKEKNIVNYSIEGNLTLSGEPSIDSPADMVGVGDGINSYFEIMTTNIAGEERVKGFLLPRALYKVGDAIDYTEYKTQATYLNTFIIDLLQILNVEDMSVFRKDSDVVYISVPYSGDPEEPCSSSIWPFNVGNITFNTENIGIDTVGDEAFLYFGLLWNRLDLAYENNIVYNIGDTEKTPLSNLEIIEIVFSYIESLEEALRRIVGARKDGVIVQTVLPTLCLYKGQNIVSINIGADDVRFITEDGKNIITESGDYLNLEEESGIPAILLDSSGNILLSEDDEILVAGRILSPALPSSFSVTYKSSILQNAINNLK